MKPRDLVEIAGLTIFECVLGDLDCQIEDWFRPRLILTYNYKIQIYELEKT